MNWISNSNNGTPCLKISNSNLQSGYYARLRNTDTLLLHSLMNAGSVTLVHLVELIDQTDSLISNHECTSFQSPLLGLEITVNGGR